MKDHPNRKQNRLPGYDYSCSGYYYITICTQERGEIFGRINNGVMELNQYGKIALKYYQEIPVHYHNVIIDEFTIMPDHVHGIIIINQPEPGNNLENERDERDERECECECECVGTEHCSVPTGSVPVPVSVPANLIDEIHNQRFGLLSKIIKSYKEIVVKTIRKQSNDYNFTWQRSFYDHIIRNELALNNIRTYIRQNPVNWKLKDRD